MGSSSGSSKAGGGGGGAIAAHTAALAEKDAAQAAFGDARDIDALRAAAARMAAADARVSATEGAALRARAAAEDAALRRLPVVRKAAVEAANRRSVRAQMAQIRLRGTPREAVANRVAARARAAHDAITAAHRESMRNPNHPEHAAPITRENMRGSTESSRTQLRRGNRQAAQQKEAEKARKAQRRKGIVV